MLEPLDAIGVVDEDGVGPVVAERAHDVTEEPAIVLELTVGIAEHDDVLDAREVRGRALLVSPFLRELGRRQ